MCLFYKKRTAVWQSFSNRWIIARFGEKAKRIPQLPDRQRHFLLFEVKLDVVMVKKALLAKNDRQLRR